MQRDCGFSGGWMAEKRAVPCLFVLTRRFDDDRNRCLGVLPPHLQRRTFARRYQGDRKALGVVGRRARRHDGATYFLYRIVSGSARLAYDELPAIALRNCGQRVLAGSESQLTNT